MAFCDKAVVIVSVIFAEGVTERGAYSPAFSSPEVVTYFDTGEGGRETI